MPVATPVPQGGADRARIAMLGMAVFLVPVGMLFLAFASAYIVRAGLGEEWLRVALPPLLWGNTAILLASSVALELGRRRSATGTVVASNGAGAVQSRAFWASLAFGVAFVVGQFVVWRQLQAVGIGVSTSGHASFVYLLTVAHALHVGAGLLGLLAVCTWPRAGRWQLTRADAARLAALYWHFLAALWVGILLLLEFGS